MTAELVDDVTKYAQHGRTVEITGLNEPSAEIHKTLGGGLTGSHCPRVPRRRPAPRRNPVRASQRRCTGSDSMP
ncbi:hypothetical protein [Streptomyces sp. NPDC006510]|uniref:hypothetical protein n=1 Tax=Streptomyces sp. NPDC006510 TaxID=3155600 RepID=UPI0033B1BD8D